MEIWHYYNGPQKTAFDDLVSQFSEGPGREQGVVVEAFSQGNVNELIQKVIDAADQKVGVGEIPDIFAAYADTAYQLDQKGLVASLDQYLTQEEINAYVTGYITEGRLDEEENLKIFPIAKSTEVFMLNKTDWDKFAGETGASLEDLSAIEGVTATARRYYEWSGGHAFFGRDAVANYMIIGSRQLGKEIFSVSGGRVTIQDDKEIVRKLWDNLYVPHVQGWFAANGKFRSDDVKTGDIIALVGSTSGSAYFPNEVNVSDTESYPIESLVMAAPCFENGEKVAVQQGAGMVVTKSDEKTEYGAVTFLKWFTDAQRNLDFSIFSGYLPVKKEANTQEILAQALEKEISRRWGAQIALDDYGTGYNGETTLLSLEPDYLKIDMSIVRNIDRDANRQMILRNIVYYARSREIQLIAEGVETRDEMEYLIRSGIHYLQGYYIGLPSPIPGAPKSIVLEEIRRLAEAQTN